MNGRRSSKDKEKKKSLLPTFTSPIATGRSSQKTKGKMTSKETKLAEKLAEKERQEREAKEKADKEEADRKEEAARKEKADKEEADQKEETARKEKADEQEALHQKQLKEAADNAKKLHEEKQRLAEAEIKEAHDKLKKHQADLELQKIREEKERLAAIEKEQQIQQEAQSKEIEKEQADLKAKAEELALQKKRTESAAQEEKQRLEKERSDLAAKEKLLLAQQEIAVELVNKEEERLRKLRAEQLAIEKSLYQQKIAESQADNISISDGENPIGEEKGSGKYKNRVNHYSESFITELAKRVVENQSKQVENSQGTPQSMPHHGNTDNTNNTLPQTNRSQGYTGNHGNGYQYEPNNYQPQGYNYRPDENRDLTDLYKNQDMSQFDHLKNDLTTSHDPYYWSQPSQDPRPSYNSAPQTNQTLTTEQKIANLQAQLTNLQTEKQQKQNTNYNSQHETTHRDTNNTPKQNFIRVTPSTNFPTPIFKGETTESFKRWKRNLQDYFKCLGWDEEHCTRSFIMFVRDRAQMFFQEMDEKYKRSTETIFDKMQEQFHNSKHKTYYTLQQLTRKQTDKESVNDFTKDFLHRIHNSDIEDTQVKLQYYITALKDDIRKEITKMKPETLDAAEQDALIVEKIIEEEKSKEGIKINTITTQPKNVSFESENKVTDTRPRSYSREHYKQNRDRRSESRSPSRYNNRDNRSRYDQQREKESKYDSRYRQRSQSYDKHKNRSYSNDRNKERSSNYRARSKSDDKSSYSSNSDNYRRDNSRDCTSCNSNRDRYDRDGSRDRRHSNYDKSNDKYPQQQHYNSSQQNTPIYCNVCNENHKWGCHLVCMNCSRMGHTTQNCGANQ